MITHEIFGMVVCRSRKSSGSARTTMDESAKATATETAMAISRIRACVGGVGLEAMAASLCGPRRSPQATRSATAANWHAAASTVSTWKSSWKPNTVGLKSGRWIAYTTAPSV